MSEPQFRVPYCIGCHRDLRHEDYWSHCMDEECGQRWSCREEAHPHSEICFSCFNKRCVDTESTDEEDETESQVDSDQ